MDQEVGREGEGEEERRRREGRMRKQRSHKYLQGSSYCLLKEEILVEHTRDFCHDSRPSNTHTIDEGKSKNLQQTDSMRDVLRTHLLYLYIGFGQFAILYDQVEGASLLDLLLLLLNLRRMRAMPEHSQPLLQHP